MEKTRVKNGEKFWYIKFYNWSLTVDWLCECKANETWAEECFKRGNYFHTEEEARKKIEELNAVFKGADVIEMPSGDEIETKAYMTAMSIVGEGDYGRDYYEGFIAGVEWLKLKIVK